MCLEALTGLLDVGLQLAESPGNILRLLLALQLRFSLKLFDLLGLAVYLLLEALHQVLQRLKVKLEKIGHIWKWRSRRFTFLLELVVLIFSIIGRILRVLLDVECAVQVEALSFICHIMPTT